VRTATITACIFTALIFPGIILAAETGAGFAAAQKSFIKKLFAEKRHFDCIAETRRLLHHEPDLERRADYLYFIGANYFLGGQYATAARLMEEPSAGESNGRSRVLRSQALSRLGLKAEALADLDSVPEESANPFLRYDIFLRRADTLLSLRRYADMLREIDAQRKFFAGSPRLAEFRRDVEDYSKLRDREGRRAALLSAALPGAGQAYSGKYLDGIVSLAAVAGAGYGAWYFYRRGEGSLACTLTFFTALFYGGNIYGAWNSAGAENSAENRRFAAGLREKYITPYDPLKFTDLPGVLP
jgi:tetratricopeptide (TPR) repeat protein